jgi:hypothetical protein
MKYTKRSVLIFTALLLATLSSLHAELGLDREAYGVWDREGGHAVAQYPFTRGQAYYELWANVNSARSNFNWAACRVAIKVGKGCAIKTGMGLEHGAMEQDDGFGERSWGVAEVEEVAVGP